MLAAVDVYQVLKADPGAPWAELRRRYRRRARELHPDGQPVRPPSERLAAARATALFAELQAAWAEVSTPERRAAYDRRRDREGPGAGRRRPAAQAAGAGSAAAAPPAPAAWAVPWRLPIPVGIVEQTAPGGLHIVVPGRVGKLSLAEFAAFANGSAAVLVGEVPPQPELRQALRTVTFVERLRLTTLVGLADPPEPRDPAEDDRHLWRAEHVRRAFLRWAAVFPERRRELPYAADLCAMGRLSLAGYQLNPPHPAGLWGAAEAPPTGREERAARRLHPLLDLQLPSPALLLVAAWSEDRSLRRALSDGMGGVARSAGMADAELAGIVRGLARPCARLDGQTPIPDGGLRWGPPGPAVRRLLLPHPAASAYLAGTDRPRQLPWGAPLAACGADRDLADAGSRLVTRVQVAVEAAIDGGAGLVSRRGARLTYRSDPGPGAARAAAAVAEAASLALGQSLGFAVRCEARLRPAAD